MLTFVDTYFVLHVFNLFMVYYEEDDLPLYVKGWSGDVLSLKGPLRKVRFLGYEVYLVLCELMHVFIISSVGHFVGDIGLVIMEKIVS